MSRRTTMTLDEDLALRLDEEARRRGTSVREVLNEALRRGLTEVPGPATSKRFRVGKRLLRAREGVSLDNIEDLLDHIEGPGRR
ncbi:MAG: CopG family transcriptional regulator [Acidobacteriota bacterium]